MSAESTTIRWDQDADGVVILTLDDPNQSANTMNAAYAASIRATVDRLEAEKDSITGVIITSAKKTFFAGGDLNDLKKATKDERRRDRRLRARRQGGPAPPGDAWASRSSPPSTARRSAAAWRSRWPATTGSSSTTPRRSSASPRSSSACSPAPAASCAPCGCSGSSTRSWGCCSRASACARPRRWRSAWSTRWCPRATTSSPRPRSGSPPIPEGSAALGRGQEVQDPRRHPVDPVAGGQPARPSRPTCASRSRAPTTPRPTTSWPRPSRAPRSTSTTPRRSRAATSWTSSPARCPRT